MQQCNLKKEYTNTNTIQQYTITKGAHSLYNLTKWEYKQFCCGGENRILIQVLHCCFSLMKQIQKRDLVKYFIKNIENKNNIKYAIKKLSTNFRQEDQPSLT